MFGCILSGFSGIWSSKASSRSKKITANINAYGHSVKFDQSKLGMVLTVESAATDLVNVKKQ